MFMKCMVVFVNLNLYLFCFKLVFFVLLLGLFMIKFVRKIYIYFNMLKYLIFDSDKSNIIKI